MLVNAGVLNDGNSWSSQCEWLCSPSSGIVGECVGCRSGPVDKISSWLGRRSVSQLGFVCWALGQSIILLRCAWLAQFDVLALPQSPRGITGT